MTGTLKIKKNGITIVADARQCHCTLGKTPDDDHIGTWVYFVTWDGYSGCDGMLLWGAPFTGDHGGKGDRFLTEHETNTAHKLWDEALPWIKYWEAEARRKAGR